MRIVSTEEMDRIEKMAEVEFGLSSELIDENVGIRAADFLYATYFNSTAPVSNPTGEIVVLVGKGNNGADGLSIARHLVNYNLHVRAFLIFNESECSAHLKKSLQLAKNFGVKISELKSIDQLQSYFRETQESFFVIDAIFGTGVRHPLPEIFSEVVTVANQYASTMISVDIPSGVAGNSGKTFGAAIEADCTLAVAMPKLGHYLSTGASLKGKLHVIPAGLPEKLMKGGQYHLLSKEIVYPYLSERYRQAYAYAHKNIFGHALVIGGSKGLTGPVILAARAALKVGTGQVTVVTWEKDYHELALRADPEMTIGLIPEDEDEQDRLIARTLKRYSSIVIGPGLGKSEESQKLIMKILKSYQGPVILDADAINALSLKESGDVLKARKSLTILTPHIGEFARFLGVDKEEVLDRPLYWLKKVIEEINCSILLKSACSYLGFPNGEIYFNDFPNDGMAKGGSGNVLSGLLVGLLAQNVPEKNSIHLGLVVHSLAGKYAALESGARSMTANSIINNLSKAFFELDEDLAQSRF